METGQYREVNAEVAASFLTHMQTTIKRVGQSIGETVVNMAAQFGR
jgi:hypothetical protein